MVAMVITPVIAYLYTVILHWRYGQTLGKMVAGIKVTRLDGSPIQLREALWRSSIEMVLSVMIIITGVYVLMTWSGPWSDLPYVKRMQLYSDRNPIMPWYDYLGQAWMWSELIVLLMNKKRRALHDFIAGTVVLNIRASVQKYPTPTLMKK